MADVGRQTRDGAIEVIAVAAVGTGVDRRQPLLGGGPPPDDRAQLPAGRGEELLQLCLQTLTFGKGARQIARGGSPGPRSEQGE